MASRTRTGISPRRRHRPRMIEGSRAVQRDNAKSPAFRAMLIYFLLVTIYLAYLAVVTREYCYGRQLWCMLLVSARRSDRQARNGL